jgi:uncharacterized protein (TIGR03435 family)
MIPANLSPVAKHLWQSTLFGAATWLLTLALRKNHAGVRYRLWLAASVKFLIPSSLLVGVGSQFVWRTSPAMGPSWVSRALDQISQPFALPVDAVPTVAAAPSSNLVSALLLSVWFCGFAISAAVWYRWWRRFRAAIRAATPLRLDLPIPMMTSPDRVEPGVFGVLKPILLLPEGIDDRLTVGQLRSILAHELCHVRRRDNLAAAMHMLVESIFWFHPLVWWVGKRLVEERERACDEEVLGAEPHVYAEGILNVCKFYLQSPIACASGVTGSDLKKRIEGIVANQVSTSLSTARKLLLAGAGIAAIGAPVLIGLWRVPSGNAQSQEKLVFEVASVKRLDPAAPGGKLGFSLTPGGGIRANCPLIWLITFAYRIDEAQLSGGPSWIRSDLYDIQAKPETFEGPEDPTVRPSEQQTEKQANRTRERLKALLADRFRLSVRTETKEAQVYVLSIAKGGHKLILDPEARGGVRRDIGVIESTGAPISYLVATLTAILGRPVLNEAGLEGRFKYKMEFRPEGLAPQEKLGVVIPAEAVADDDARPPIFMAIKSQLGLELQSKTGPVTSVVIERIERPTEN